jgi:hypothetical protein
VVMAWPDHRGDHLTGIARVLRLETEDADLHADNEGLRARRRTCEQPTPHSATAARQLGTTCRPSGSPAAHDISEVQRRGPAFVPNWF